MPRIPPTTLAQFEYTSGGEAIRCLRAGPTQRRRSNCVVVLHGGGSRTKERFAELCGDIATWEFRLSPWTSPDIGDSTGQLPRQSLACGSPRPSADLMVLCPAGRY